MVMNNVEKIKPMLIEGMAAMLPEVELPRITNAQTLSELEFASYESFKDNGMDGYHGLLLFAGALREVNKR